MIPVSGNVTTTSPINIRSGKPSISAPVAMTAPRGSVLKVNAVVMGDTVNGNSQWYAGDGNTFFWTGGVTPLKNQSVAASQAAQGGFLAGRIQSAPAGSHGVDIDRPLSAADAATLVSMGYTFCLRYITRDQAAPQPGDLTRGEAELILAAGLALMPVQHVSKPPWVPNAGLGATYGGNAKANAQACGLPPGVNVWLDLEGVRGGTAAADVIAYCNAWFAAVADAGYATGVYVGDSAGLTGDQLFWQLKTTHYWKSGSAVPDIPQRGYQMVQHIPADTDDNDASLDNLDQNVTQTDNFGTAVQWLVRP
jgi:hypothetical protein